MQNKNESLKERLLANKNKKYSKKADGGQLDSVSDMLPTKEPMSVMEQPDMSVINPIDVTQTIQQMNNGGGIDDGFKKVWGKFKSDTAEAFTGKKEVYVDFLNSKNSFKRERKHFASYEEAYDWCKENFEKFNPDMIHHNYADGGMTEAEKNLPKEILEMNISELKELLKNLSNLENHKSNYAPAIKVLITERTIKGVKEKIDEFANRDYGGDFPFSTKRGIPARKPSKLAEKTDNELRKISDENESEEHHLLEAIDNEDDRKTKDHYQRQHNDNKILYFQIQREFKRRGLNQFDKGGNVEPNEEFRTVMSGELSHEDIRDAKERYFKPSPDSIYETDDVIDYWGMETMKKGGATMKSIPIMQSGKKVSMTKKLPLRQDKDNQIKDLIAFNKNDYYNFSENELNILRTYQSNSTLPIDLADKIWGIAVNNGFKVHDADVYIRNTGTGNLLQFVSEHFNKVQYDTDLEMSRKICNLLYPQRNIEVVKNGVLTPLGFDSENDKNVERKKDLCIYANFDDVIFNQKHIGNCDMVVYCGYMNNANSFRDVIPSHYIAEAYKLPEDILINGVIIAFKRK